MKARKPNFKKIDLAAPVWVPKVGEMCEYKHPLGVARCKVTLLGVDDEAMVEYESPLDGKLRMTRCYISDLKEGTAPASKLDQLAVLMKTDRWGDALRMAAKFQDLGDHKKAITQGWAAISNPTFYRQINQDPDVLVAAGIAALKERYVK